MRMTTMTHPLKTDGMPLGNYWPLPDGRQYLDIPYRTTLDIPKHECRFEEYDLKEHLRCKRCGLLREKTDADL